MAFTALLEMGLPVVVTGGLVIALWAIRWPSVALAFLGFSLISGQVLRLPLPGQGGGLLVSDVAVVLVLLSTLWHLKPREVPTWPKRWFWLSLPFIGWSLATLVIHTSLLGWTAFGVAAAYWVRLTLQLLLIPALALLVKQYSLGTLLRRQFTWTIFILIVAGFAQLYFLPYLARIGGGWDPHEYRLVSTWLDPNFFGGFLILILPWLFSQGRRYQGLTLLALVALGLTRSRSGLVALSVSLVSCSPIILMTVLPTLRPRKRLGWVLSSLGIGITTIGLLLWILGSRAVGLLTADATVSLHVQAWQQAWQLVQAHWWVGVGYNAYQYAAAQAGLLSNFTIHSRAGTDSSLLTLWVTTGVIGVLLYSLPWLYTLQTAGRRLPDKSAIVVLISGLAWFVDAQFINSGLYSHLLITAAIMLTLCFY